MSKEGQLSTRSAKRRGFAAGWRCGAAGCRTLATVVLLVGLFLAGGCQQENRPPRIVGLAVERDALPFSGVGLVECIAEDDDGDEIVYEWWASGGDIDGAGSVVSWRAPRSEGEYGVLVTVRDGRGGEAHEHVMITVKENFPPEVVRLTSDCVWVPPSGRCEIVCEAVEPDGEELAYEWSAECGDIEGEGAGVIWTAPGRVGLFDVEVVVEDARGEYDARRLTLSVAREKPPTIRELRVTPSRPKYLKGFEGGYRILQGESCEISCVTIDDGRQLTYQWLAGGREISWHSPEIHWVAPTARTELAVTVVVSDQDGNMATRTVQFKVETCTCAFK